MDNTAPHIPQRPEGFSTRVPAHERPPAGDSGSFAFLLPPVEADEIGRLGNYRVLRLLGKGGMGLVFHAEDIALRRPVALKVMRPGLSGEIRGVERFLREARAMASIKHESLVTVYQIGQENGLVYLAMELLEGRSLEDWLTQVGQPDLPTILRLGQEIVSGLTAIHRRGLIHRDLKPMNLWLEEPSGRVKILDFGLARMVDDDAYLTQSGAVLGTPAFMSPEQARGEPLDYRSDLFSFGCVLYTLCTGTDPFCGTNTTAVLTALATQQPCPVHQRNPAIPRALSNLVAQLLSKQPQERPTSAEAVLERLRRIERGSGVRSATSEVEADGDLPAARTGGPSRGWWAKVPLAIAIVTVAALTPWLISPLFRSGANGTSPPSRPSPHVAPPPRGGSTQGKVYLAELHPIQQEHWPFDGPPPPGKPPIKNLGGVTVQGKDSPHGIFMHPPPAWEGAASITYQLRGEFKTFHATVSMNDGPPMSEEPFTCEVYGDGRPLWKSRPMSSQADAQTISIPVQGVDRVKIAVQSSGEPKGAHAVWVEPYLAK